MTSMFIKLFFAPALISSILVIVIRQLMLKFHAFQAIREEGPSEHLKKYGTPTMGGLGILLSMLICSLMTSVFNDISIQLVCLLGISMALIGGADDWLKVSHKNSRGLRGRHKIILEFIFGGLFTYALLHFNIIDSKVYFFSRQNPVVDLGTFFPLYGSFLIAAACNAVNLTDGLDGLVSMPIVFSSIVLGIIAITQAHLNLMLFNFIIIGSVIGFLFHNRFPAKIFMGDVGSLPLGAILGAISLILKVEILFQVIGGIFVIESLSVITQVLSFKFRGIRIFKMAPLHHHFELSGKSEKSIVRSFWFVSLLFGFLGLWIYYQNLGR